MPTVCPVLGHGAYKQRAQSSEEDRVRNMSVREATSSLDKEKGKNILPRGNRYEPLNTL